MYSLIITAKLNDVDPRAWLADVLARMVLSACIEAGLLIEASDEGLILSTFDYETSARATLQAEVADEAVVVAAEPLERRRHAVLERDRPGHLVEQLVGQTAFAQPGRDDRRTARPPRVRQPPDN